MVVEKGQRPEIKAFLKESLGSVKAFLHSVSTTQYTIDGDTARTRTAVYNPMEIDSNGTPSVMVFNLWYHHEFVRTEQGWRISSLREQDCISENVPDWVKALPKSQRQGTGRSEERRVGKWCVSTVEARGGT